jgi:hypothetical protein
MHGSTVGEQLMKSAGGVAASTATTAAVAAHDCINDDQSSERL